MYKYYAMGLEKIYSALTAKKVDEGIAFLVTSESHLIEAHLYGNIIINLKSRHMPVDQLARQLTSVALKDANVSAAAIRLAHANPDIIAATFPPSAELALSAELWTPAKRLRTLKLLAHLQTTESAGGTAAAEMIATEIARRYPRFSLSRTTLEKRAAQFSEDFRFPLPFLPITAIPDNPGAVPAWLTSSCKELSPLLENVLLNYLVFGETLHRIYEGVAKRENTLETKTGCVRISRVLYHEAGTSPTVSLFSGFRLVGVFNVTPLDDRRLDIHLSGEDAAKTALRDGDPLYLIFAK